MKRNILFLLIAAFAFAGCRSGNTPVADAENNGCLNCDSEQTIKYSMPNGNDLMLETGHYILRVEAQPGKQYDYYVWTGEKTYDDDPDMIVQDGVTAILTVE